MQLLESYITKYGKALPGDILKVDSFLNFQIDVELLDRLACDIYQHFKDKNINKILTVEASGIALSTLVAKYFNCKLVFAKKSKTLNMSDDFYSEKCFSFTHKTQNNLMVSKSFLTSEDNVLVVDDFLANGEACNSLLSIINQANAKLQGIAIAVEKAFQGAGDRFRSSGIDLYSLAIIESMNEGKIEFR